MSINFYDHNGQKYICIEDGHLIFEEAAEKESPSGEYVVAAGYWKNNDENSEYYGDDIDGSAEAIILKDGAIAYRVKGIEFLDGESTIIRNDGSLFVFEDDAISIWSGDGKPTKKRFSCSCDDYGMSDDIIWASGYGEDDNLRLSVFSMDTGKMWTKKLKNDICQIRSVFMAKNEADPSKSYIAAVAETYENGDTFLKYGLDGKKQEITIHDLREIKSAAPTDRETEPQSISEDMTDSPPKKEFPMWAIILIVVIALLALIGKNI